MGSVMNLVEMATRSIEESTMQEINPSSILKFLRLHHKLKFKILRYNEINP